MNHRGYIQALTKPCPFCNEIPAVWPEDPKTQGDAWGAVVCVNKECPTYNSSIRHGVMVMDGEDCCDERGSLEYIRAAMLRWNKGRMYRRARGRTHLK